MPIYEYQCKKCSHRFERIQKFSDAPVKTCPQCGGKVERLISSPAVQFKGTGWYVTDYARKGSSPSSSGDKGEKKTETKSDDPSRSAEKKDAKPSERKDKS